MPSAAAFPWAWRQVGGRARHIDKTRIGEGVTIRNAEGRADEDDATVSTCATASSSFPRTPSFGNGRRTLRRADYPHHPDCVGCPLIGTAYGQQLRLKREKLAAALARHESLAALEVPEVVGSPKAFGYRTQAKLVLRRAGRGVLAGSFRPGTHQVVDISRCPVHHPLINQVVAAACEQIEARDLAVYDERSGEGLLRHLVVRVSAWEKRAQLILVSTRRAC
jgi:23S rRNA (uracil1939-C5)-methyltransferase